MLDTNSNSIKRKLVVFDDDPTGIQTVHNCKVLTVWDEHTLSAAFADDTPFFYILTNIRAYPFDKAKEIIREAASMVYKIARKMGIEIQVLARSDSTLRSHFPLELEQFLEVFGPDGPVDGIIYAPALFESGRITAGNVHYVIDDDKRIPAHKTEFAKDPDFSYSSALLPEYIEEKIRVIESKGSSRFSSTGSQDVTSISLDMIRNGGTREIEKFLMRQNNSRFIVVNSEDYNDLDTVTAAIRNVVAKGKRFLYHTSSSFVRSYVQQREKRIEFASFDAGPGVVIAGSYVEKTKRQVDSLLSTPSVVGVQVPVLKIVDEFQAEKQRVLEEIASALRQGNTAVVYLHSTQKPTQTGSGAIWETGRKINAFFCECVDELKVVPAFIIGKGGITSHEVLKNGLKVASARVAGQVVPGVPAIRMEPDHRLAGMYYIIFPGNVGTDKTLAQVVHLLT